MSTVTDDKIRHYLERLDEAAPVAPRFEDLTLPAIEVTATRSRRGVGVMFAAAACVLILIVGLAAVVNTESDPGTSANSQLPAPQLTPTSRFGLPFAVLPAELPDGWDIVDIGGAPVQQAANPGNAQFLFRDPDSGAAALVQTTVDLNLSLGDPVSTDTFEANSEVMWALDGGFVTMRTAGIDPDRATEIRQALSFDTIDGRLIASLPADTGFELESTQAGTDTTPLSSVSAAVVLTTPHGTAYINLSTGQDSAVIDHFGVPREIVGTTVYESATEVHRDPLSATTLTGPDAQNPDGGAHVSAWIEVTDPADIADASTLAAQLQAVPFEEWAAHEDRIAAELSALPTVRSLSFDGVEATEHSTGDQTAVCASWTGTRRCRLVADANWPVNLVVNGLWIAVGELHGGAPVDDFTIVGDLGDSVGKWEPTDKGAFIAYAFPTATHATWQFDAGIGGNGDGMTDRPIG